MYNYEPRSIALKKLIQRIRDLRYRKRLKKWFAVNIKFIWRKLLRFVTDKKTRRALYTSHAIISYVAVLSLVGLFVGMGFFVKYACPFFNEQKGLVRNLSMGEYDEGVSYLKTLDMLGSSDRVQIMLKTDDDDRFLTKGTGLDGGNVNLLLVFSDGKESEYSLTKPGYDTFEAGMTDTFTIVLPDGKTPFDVTEYRLIILPDINNEYDEWHCRWARIYFLLEGEPVMLAKESWDTVAVFGQGETAVHQSSLAIVSDTITSYARAKTLYGHFDSFNKWGLDDAALTKLKADTLDAIGLNGGKVLYLNVETANTEVQNKLLTYYTKGVTIPDIDSFDYDGLMYLDINFYTRLKDGSHSKRFTLDTLGTDDFEMGSTSAFRIEMPEGMTVFDISSMRLVADNPHDAWAPRFMRVYVETDYKERLEIARITDTMLIKTHATAVFYNNLIDNGIDIDLTSMFCLSEAEQKALEDKMGYTVGKRAGKLYYTLQSFYDRQNYFFEQMVDIYKQSHAEEDKPSGGLPEITPDGGQTPETEQPIVDDTTPEADPNVPVEDPNAPVEDPNGPVEDPNAPVVDPNAPVVDPNAPVVDPNAPVVDPNAPVVDPNAPVVDPNAPVVDPNAPVVDPNEPVVDPNVPVVDPNTPVVDPNVPVVDPVTPEVAPDTPVVLPDRGVVDDAIKDWLSRA